MLNKVLMSVKKFGLFLLTRSFIVFVLIIYGSSFFIDYLKVESATKIRTLHYLQASSFDSFLNIMNDSDSFDRDELREYLFFYQKAVEYMPDSAAANSLLGVCYYKLGDVKNAEIALRRAIQLKGDVFWFYHNLAVLYYSEKEYHKAVIVLKKALGQSANQNLKFLELAKRFYHPIIKASGLKAHNVRLRLKDGYRDCYVMLITSYKILGNQSEVNRAKKYAIRANVGFKQPFFIDIKNQDFRMKIF